jgi:hypothetical protein
MAAYPLADGMTGGPEQDSLGQVDGPQPLREEPMAKGIVEVSTGNRTSSSARLGLSAMADLASAFGECAAGDDEPRFGNRLRPCAAQAGETVVGTKRPKQISQKWLPARLGLSAMADLASAFGECAAGDDECQDGGGEAEGLDDPCGIAPRFGNRLRPCAAQAGETVVGTKRPKLACPPWRIWRAPSASVRRATTSARMAAARPRVSEFPVDTSTIPAGSHRDSETGFAHAPRRQARRLSGRSVTKRWHANASSA